MTDWIPLFPLNAVLFPDGILPLRVFEARYVDMVSECMRNDKPFGVVLIKSGREVALGKGQAAEPEAVGCLASITQLDMVEPGILTLRTKGGERFRILETRVLADNRLEARVEILEADSVEAPSEEHVRCAESLKNVIENIVTKGRAEQGADFDNPFSMPAQFDNAGWVANRWCEILPIPLKARQKLLELGDPQSRLQIVYQFLLQHQLLHSR
jgi:Lon protease-like protein